METSDDSTHEKIGKLKNRMVIFADFNQFENNEIETPTDNLKKIRRERD